MIHELTIYKLGKLLNELKLKYNMNLLLKRKLSGGFITIVGEVDVNYIPEDKETLKGNNIIGLKVKNDNGQMDLKITGIKGNRNDKYNKVCRMNQISDKLKLLIICLYQSGKFFF